MPQTKRKEIKWERIFAGLGIGLSAFGLGYVIMKDRKKDELPFIERYTKSQIKNSNISGSQALRRANQLFTAMDGANWDNAVAVARPLNNVNASGLRLIVNKFGRRAGTYTFIPENLYQWFGGESEKTQKYARAIWKNRGLTPPF